MLKRQSFILNRTLCMLLYFLEFLLNFNIFLLTIYVARNQPQWYLQYLKNLAMFQEKNASVNRLLPIVVKWSKLAIFGSTSNINDNS